MKLLALATSSILLSSSLFSYDLSLKQDTPLMCDLNKTKALEIPKKIKKYESHYDKLSRKLSEYRGSMFQDMFIYSADIFIPDELMRAGRDVLTNRQDNGFGEALDKKLQTIASDSMNVIASTAYYYLQDMAHISERVWKNQACNPEYFTYDAALEPKVPLLDLSACDPQARGVTKSGIVIPYNPNFPKALYPYAAKPDGCSAEGLQDLYDQSNDLSNDAKWFESVCDEHDRCYYTEGTTSKECNAKFIVEIMDACNKIETKDTLRYAGIKNAFCTMKGFWIASGANACARKYFDNAQKKQKAYNRWVERYEKAYRTLEKKQKTQHKGH